MDVARLGPLPELGMIVVPSHYPRRFWSLDSGAHIRGLAQWSLEIHARLFKVEALEPVLVLRLLIKSNVDFLHDFLILF